MKDAKYILDTVVNEYNINYISSDTIDIAGGPLAYNFVVPVNCYIGFSVKSKLVDILFDETTNLSEPALQAFLNCPGYCHCKLQTNSGTAEFADLILPIKEHSFSEFFIDRDELGSNTLEIRLLDYNSNIQSALSTYIFSVYCHFEIGIKLYYKSNFNKEQSQIL